MNNLENSNELSIEDKEDEKIDLDPPLIPKPPIQK